MCRIGFLSILYVLSLLTGCGDDDHNNPKKSLFRLVPASVTKIDFANTLPYTEELNTYTFRNFYNGGGVGLGDLNNDGLTDIFFAGNLVPNRLYLNEENFKFKDISGKAGIGGHQVWTTGVSIADINGDGWLDVYLCKSGPPGGERRYNELFINNGDLTFTEKAHEYGLAFEGLSIHASFFDYDKDGDLDCYLLNNSIRTVGIYDLRKGQREIPDPLGGNKLLRNDDGQFTVVSADAGIYTSEIGFGLGVAVGDINKDTWPDLYVSNDFFEKDYLYINQKDGTFKESLEQFIREISLGSMGADMADVNNDAWPEIFVTEMLPESDDRLKTTTQFEDWNKYSRAVEQGYYHQFSRNVLQLNNGDGTFSEIGRLAGVHASDWSWGALIFDMDNDGLKDIFVANGIFKDLLDQDYVNFVSNRNMVRQILEKKGTVIKQLIDSIPSNKIPNFAFQNMGNLLFENKASQWGLGAPTHSNGSAYGDLDNDGDLDLVMNNVNMPAFVYENTSDTVHADNAFLSLRLHGNGRNPFAIGSKITLKTGNKTFYQEHFPMRGFMSSVDYKIHVGMGRGVTNIDSLIVEWPNDRVTILTNVKPNQLLHVYQKDAIPFQLPRDQVSSPSIFSKVHVPGARFKHRENDFVDFDRDRLLFTMRSNEGPCLCIGDVNGDGLQDFYAGGARGQAGSLFVQGSAGNFTMTTQVFEKDKDSEDTDCIFFDADNDGRQDLYVASGSNELSGFSAALADRLYFNRGKEGFEKSKQVLPVATKFESTSAVTSSDYDKDGDQDLFVGARLIPVLYGVPASGYLLKNDGAGKFTDVTAHVAPELQNIGLITDARWVDINNDSLSDLVVVGEWMPIQILLNTGKSLQKDESLFQRTNGWYHCIEAGDFNNDGRIDLVFGNHGLNSRFKASEAEPVQLYINDFDTNGSVEHITTRYYEGRSLPLVLRQDLVAQIPSLKKKYLHYENYTGQTITDIFTHGQLTNAITLSAYDLETSLWLNDPDGAFTKAELPVEAQFSPMYAILADDIDGDNNLDLVMGGNLHRGKPETGIYDGSYGAVLKGDGKGNFRFLSARESGLRIKGEVRGLAKISETMRMLVIAKNNSDVEFFTY
jgi:hypothetical protein